MDGWNDGWMEKPVYGLLTAISTNGVNLIRIESCFDFLIIDNFKKPNI